MVIIFSQVIFYRYQRMQQVLVNSFHSHPGEVLAIYGLYKIMIPRSDA